MSYIVNLAKELTNINFNISSGLCSSQNITEHSRFVTFLRQEGHILYCVVIINCDMEKEYKESSEMVFKSLYDVKCNKVIVNIFLSSSPDDELQEYINNDIEDYNMDTVNIKWLVDTNHDSIIVKGSQPDDVLGLKKAMITAFENKDDSFGVNTGELKKQTEIIEQSFLKTGTSYVTYTFMALNFLFFIIMYTKTGDRLISSMWLDKELVFKGEIYRLFTYMFTHGGFAHFLCNTFTLYIIGTRLEKYCGYIKFLALYILSGIFAAAISCLVNSSGIAVGASGAIFGIIGGLIYMIGKLKRNIGGFDYSVAIMYAIVGIFSGFMMENIDNFAHIGGLLGGLVLSAVLRLEK